MTDLSAMTKAGFMATPQEWDKLVGVAEELARQLAQAQKERDAALAQLASENGNLVWTTQLKNMWRDASEERTAWLLKIVAERDAAYKRDLKRAAAARKVAQWARGQSYELHISNLCDQNHVIDYEIAERDLAAARAEVARVTELAITERDSGAMEIERLKTEVARLTAAGDAMRGIVESVRDGLRKDAGGDNVLTIYADQVLEAWLARRGHPAPAQVRE